MVRPADSVPRAAAHRLRRLPDVAALLGPSGPASTPVPAKTPLPASTPVPAKTPLPARTPVPAGGFAHHLRDAIALNQERRAFYSRLTGGRSEALSDRLIWQERLALLAAWYIDFRARGFGREGIPVVSADFMPMAAARSAGTPPLLRGVASAADLEAARAIVRALDRRLGEALGRSDFAQVARACYEATTALEALEHRTGAAFTMARHVIDSIGIGALGAREYAAASGGRTVGLSRQFLRAQAWALGTVVETDRLAQPLNARGAGILVNDVPHIPFVRRYLAELP